MEGYVYILVNSSFPDLVKIGRTIKTPEGRAAELSATGTPGRFVVAYSALVDNCIEVEAEMHAFFSKQRHTNDREFFEISSSNAIDILIDITKDKKINEQEKTTSKNTKEDSVLFLAKITTGIYRIGLLRKPRSFLDTQDFKKMMFELYQIMDLEISLSISIEKCCEFNYINDEFHKKMLTTIDNYLNSMKKRHSAFAKNKYDNRTLSYGLTREPPPEHIFDLALSLVKPIGDTAASKFLKDFEENKDIIKQQKIDKLKILGL